MLPYLPPEIVRKIFAYNIPRYIDCYHEDIARQYNVRPRPEGTYQFLIQFSDHQTVMEMIDQTYGYNSLSLNQIYNLNL